MVLQEVNVVGCYDVRYEAAEKTARELDNHSDAYFAVFRFIGTEGVITGTLRAMYNYPDGQPDTLVWSSRRHYPDKCFEAKLEGKWIHDSYIGPTASLMQAIQDDGVPETDGFDRGHRRCRGLLLLGRQ